MVASGSFGQNEAGAIIGRPPQIRMVRLAGLVNTGSSANVESYGIHLPGTADLCRFGRVETEGQPANVRKILRPAS